MNYIKVAPAKMTDKYFIKVATIIGQYCLKVAIIIAGKNVPAVVSLTILAVMLYGR